jgi:hypothetical protein
MMKYYINLERAKDYLHICDFKGYANMKTYYIHKKKTKEGLYHANMRHGVAEFSTNTLDEMSAKLKSLQRV